MAAISGEILRMDVEKETRPYTTVHDTERFLRRLQCKSEELQVRLPGVRARSFTTFVTFSDSFELLRQISFSLGGVHQHRDGTDDVPFESNRCNLRARGFGSHKSAHGKAGAVSFQSARAARNVHVPRRTNICGLTRA